MIALVALSVLALGVGLLSGVVGTGASLVLLPALVALDGPRVAVPVMGIASVLGNLGRVAAWWRDIDWRPTLAYALPGLPAAALGAHTLLTIPPTVTDVALIVFFLAMIPGRRLLAARRRPLTWRHMAVAGALVGFLTGLVLSTGPLSVPVFTGYGLAGGAFLGSEAAAALLLYTAKMLTFGASGALTADVVVRGLAIGVALLAGSLIARPIVRRLPVHVFTHLIDGVLVAAAVGLLLDLVL